MSLNVNRGINDPFYRYKMPALVTKEEGRGNGVKTVLENISDIGRALGRPPMYATKFLGCELGAQTKFDEKNERHIITGIHDVVRLQDLLDGFIKRFVLCAKCDNPETVLKVRRGQIHSRCQACGHAFMIDNKHKLATYIIKNPPKAEDDITKVKKKDSNNGSKEEIVEETNEYDKNSEGDIEAGIDDDDWADPIDESGKLAAGIGKLVIDKDMEKSVDERLDILEKCFIRAKEESSVGDGKALVDEAERLDVKQKAVLVLAVTLLDQNVLSEGQLKKYRTAFLRFTNGDQKSQRYLLGGIEMLIVRHGAELLPKAAHIMKALYDLDIVEEETLLAWGQKPSSKYVKKDKSKEIIDKCQALLNWLNEAEEESEESEEEEDDEVAFDTNARDPGLSRVVPVVVKEEIKVQNEDGVVIDIDDI